MHKPPTPETHNYIIPTPNFPELPQDYKNPQNLNGAPCIRHPKIAERPYQHTFLKNPEIPILTIFNHLKPQNIQINNIK